MSRRIKRQQKRKQNQGQKNPFQITQFNKQPSSNQLTLVYKRQHDFSRDTADIPITLFMRPSTYALGSTTFGFYSDSFHSQIRSLALYYELVEFKSFSVEYVPPVAVGAAAQLLQPAMQVCMTYTPTGNLLANGSLADYGNMKSISRLQGITMRSQPSVYAKQLGIPKFIGSTDFVTVGTSNLSVPETICYYLPSESGSGTIQQSLGSFIVEVVYHFVAKAS